MTRAAAAFAAALMLQVTGGAGIVERAAPFSVRFHHLHFKVGDPAAAMRQYASRLGGTRLIVPGLGVGVRVGAEYLLFDRANAGLPRRGAAPAAAYRAAAAWLVGHGAAVSPATLSSSALANLGSAPVLDHVGFVAADLPSAVAALGAAGARPFKSSADAAMFRERNGAVVEIVRDTMAEDVYWCPMHPDIRSSIAGVCPICSMTLVPIPPPRLGEYRMDVTATAGERGGVSRLRIAIRDPETNAPVPGFAVVHERLLHFFIVGRALEYFEHVHPDRIGPGTFELTRDIPPGEYMLIADFLPQGGSSQMVHRILVTPGYHGPLFPPPQSLTPDDGIDKTVDGVRVHLDASSLRAGKEASLRFTLAEAGSGAPVVDLEPFLGAPGHLLIVTGDLTDAIHAHPEGHISLQPDIRFGPTVVFEPLMPAPGTYKLWVQFQRKGKVLTVPFVIAVPDPQAGHAAAQTAATTRELRMRSSAVTSLSPWIRAVAAIN